MSMPAKDVAFIVLAAYVPLGVLSFWGIPELLRQFYLSNALPLMLLSHAVPVLTLAFTRPSSPVRLTLLPFASVASICYHRLSPEVFPNRNQAGGLDGPFMLLFLTVVDVFGLQRLYMDDRGVERKGRPDIGKEKKEMGDQSSLLKASPQNPWTRLKWAMHVMFSYRAIGTSRQTPNIPSFYPDIPSRMRFIWSQCIACALGYLVLDLLANLRLAPVEAFSAERAAIFLSPQLWTLPCLRLRLIATFLFWVDRYTTVRFIYDITSIFGVATGLTEPKDWPPYFGSIENAWTIRRFWAVFWHSGLRNPLSSNIRFIVYDVLRLRKRSFEGRVLTVLLTFGLSGTIHYFVDEVIGIPGSDNRAILAFMIQAVGITIEDLAQQAYFKLTKPKVSGNTGRSGEVTARQGELPETWQLLVGYIWVAVWLLYTASPYAYGYFRNAPESMFAVSVIQLLKQYLA
ncbi:membrane bound O-acyl transferase family-domain-containing protein [Aspergillus pseudotamarii]|uniref:Membrane bound O-acyl transferase family-domain-containing protein n=1 Tax=Aspergillus pseudotamarii TaxID=132259 RepID=A0A5N6SVL4_ASPPS|nr:membrane bound O-acyl transferase family-domain-containing protein [Aspergillus pseudotamarii]KAE8137821.1 membrane bound O-acyl transferase family-domain-containing protein [Aspergillus pseudotamarii]